MKKELICLLLCCAGTAVAQQNSSYVIKGTMTVDSLRYTPERIKKVYLTHEVQGQDVVVDSATVENGRFTFKGKAPGVLAPYRISGFDNGTVQLFLEPGEITVLPFDGRFPVGASVKGTPGNDVLFAYQQSGSGAVDIAKQRMDKVLASLPPEQRNDEKAFYPYQRATYYVNSLSHRTTAMRFVARHLDSPVTLYIIKYDLLRFFTPQVLEETYLNAVPAAVRKHPMYRELTNLVRAANLEVGKPAPDIDGLTPDGKRLALSDLKGKYVLIDFWASWCAPCRREFPVIKQALQETQGKVPFMVLSYSIDSKKKEWTDCIERNSLTHANWQHISALKGWSSPAAKLYNVEAVPRTVLISPEGNIVAFDLRGEQLIEAVRKMKSTVAKRADSPKAKADATKTVTNEVKEIPDKPLYEEYLALERQRDKQIAEDLAKLRSTKGEAYLNTADGKIDAESIRRAAEIGWTAERFQFLLDHNTSPLMPLLVERDMLPIFNKEYGRQLSAAVAPQVLTHPYARSLENNVRSRNLMQGSDVPDIALPLANGTVRQLSNSLGKFVLLTFWASGCPACQRDLPLLKKLYDESRGSKDKFEMIGFSLDKNPKEWKKAMKTLGIDGADWLQACDFKGSASPSVRLFNVGETPTNVLIDPEGKAISLTLQGEELVTRVKQILSGDLYYQKEDSKK